MGRYLIWIHADYPQTPQPADFGTECRARGSLSAQQTQPQKPEPDRGAHPHGGADGAPRVCTPAARAGPPRAGGRKTPGPCGGAASGPRAGRGARRGLRRVAALRLRCTPVA